MCLLASCVFMFSSWRRQYHTVWQQLPELDDQGTLGKLLPAPDNFDKLDIAEETPLHTFVLSAIPVHAPVLSAISSLSKVIGCRSEMVIVLRSHVGANCLLLPPLLKRLFVHQIGKVATDVDADKLGLPVILEVEVLIADRLNFCLTKLVRRDDTNS